MVDGRAQRKGAIEDRRPRTDDMQRGVVVLSRIPFGFFEEPMRAFFKQFGTVTRLRLARNPKVGLHAAAAAWTTGPGPSTTATRPNRSCGRPPPLAVADA